MHRPWPRGSPPAPSACNQLALGLPNGVAELTVGVGQASRSDGGPLPCRLRLALGLGGHLRGDRLDLLRVALARDERPACAGGHRAPDCLRERLDPRTDGARTVLL